MEDLIVVGAGIAGIHCALEARAAGLRTVLVDKGSRPGGRMATRPVDGHLADHGAQFLELASPQARQHLRRWREQGLAEPWSYGFVGEANGVSVPRYRVPGGMNRLPTVLCASLQTRFRWEAASVRRIEQGWRVAARDGNAIEARALVISCPVPQALRLLRAGNVTMSAEHNELLESVQYHPCFTLLVRLTGESGVPCPGGKAFQTEPIAWIADNQQKGVSSDATVMTIHATHSFSERHLEDDPARMEADLLDAASPYLPTPAASTHLHRWRFARPRNPLSERFLTLEADAPLLLAGDAFGGNGIESALLSGIASAGEVLRHVAPPVSANGGEANAR